MKFFRSAAFALAHLVVSQAATARPITVATLNIAWYGLGGSPDNGPESESRDPTIKQFIDRNLADADVIALEEIVDVARFENNIMSPGRKCTSYFNEDAKHQHVVVCVKPDLKFEPVENGGGFTVDSIAMGRYRPAVHGVIQTLDGQKLLYLAALHLKAGPDNRDLRVMQINMLSEFIKTKVHNIPVVITGDFNTWGSDANEFQNAFNATGVGITEVHNQSDFTFNDIQLRQKFDRFWVSNDTQIIQAPVVYGPCNLDPWTNRATIRWHMKTVSDHCAVKATIETSPQTH